MIRKALLTLAVAAAGLSATVFSQTRVDALHHEATDDELLYIPSKAILKHLTAGMSNVVADLLWIETIQYTVREYHNPERKFAWLNHMINASVELDPYFTGVYQQGGMFLSAVGSDDMALDLLERGYVKNPDTWQIPYEIVKIFTLNRRDEAESPALAAQWLRIMAPHHQYPELYLNWARQIEQRNNLAGQSRAIWEDVIATAKDPFVREVAQRNLRILVADDAAKALQGLAERYASEQGHAPASLNEFVRLGWIDHIPVPEQYGEFFLDETGRVQSVVVLEDTRDRMLLGLNTQITLMSNEHGRKPVNLDELAQWMGNPVPAHPVPGRTWTYDPNSGKIS